MFTATDASIIGLRLTLELIAYYNAKIMYSYTGIAKISPLVTLYISHSLGTVLFLRDIFVHKIRYLQVLRRDTAMAPRRFIYIVAYLSLFYNLCHIPKFYAMNFISDVSIVSIYSSSVIFTYLFSILILKSKIDRKGVFSAILGSGGLLLLLIGDCQVCGHTVMSVILFVSSVFAGMYGVLFKMSLEEQKENTNRIDAIKYRLCSVSPHTNRSNDSILNQVAISNQHSITDGSVSETETRLITPMQNQVTSYDQYSIGNDNHAPFSIIFNENITCIDSKSNLSRKRTPKTSLEENQSEKNIDIDFYNQSYSVSSESDSSKLSRIMSQELTSVRPNQISLKSKINDSKNTQTNNSSLFEKSSNKKGLFQCNCPEICKNTELNQNNITDNRKGFAFGNIFSNLFLTKETYEQKNFIASLESLSKIEPTAELHQLNIQPNSSIQIKNKNNASGITDSQNLNSSKLQEDRLKKRNHNQASCEGNLSSTADKNSPPMPSEKIQFLGRTYEKETFNKLLFMRHYMSLTGLITFLFYWPGLLIVKNLKVDNIYLPTNTRPLLHILLANIISVTHNIIYFVIVCSRSPLFGQISGIILQPTFLFIQIIARSGVDCFLQLMGCAMSFISFLMLSDRH